MSEVGLVSWRSLEGTGSQRQLLICCMPPLHASSSRTALGLQR